MCAAGRRIAPLAARLTGAGLRTLPSRVAARLPGLAVGQLIVPRALARFALAGVGRRWGARL
ncbi:MAG TPA: hypothetical protein PJ982_11365, partial [Lacipirellulaceae bacterium]|nr:hypothetical protein [Lacipirellulaceae bacterium]